MKTKTILMFAALGLMLILLMIGFNNELSKNNKSQIASQDSTQVTSVASGDSEQVVNSDSLNCDSNSTDSSLFGPPINDSGDVDSNLFN